MVSSGDAAKAGEIGNTVNTMLGTRESAEGGWLLIYCTRKPVIFIYLSERQRYLCVCALGVGWLCSLVT